MPIRALAIVATLILTAPADAAHCPHGQWWRGALHRCFVIGDPRIGPYGPHGRRFIHMAADVATEERMPPAPILRPPAALPDEIDAETGARMEGLRVLRIELDRIVRERASQ